MIVITVSGAHRVVICFKNNRNSVTIKAKSKVCSYVCSPILCFFIHRPASRLHIYLDLLVCKKDQEDYFRNPIKTALILHLYRYRQLRFMLTHMFTNIASNFSLEMRFKLYFICNY